MKMISVWILVLVWLPSIITVLSHALQSVGEWHLLVNNTGVVGMHMAVTHLNTVLLFDQTGAGPSNYPLLHKRRCPPNSTRSSCFAHSVEYSISTNLIRPLLNLDTDPWCSSASFLSSGALLNTGGFGPTGSRSIRYFRPCSALSRQCGWLGPANHTRLSKGRWYASSVLLPGKDDRVMVMGGRRAFSYEFFPKTSAKEKAIDLPMLHSTFNRREAGGNLYPFLHLSSDGHLFVFANRDSILLDYSRNRVVKKYPKIPGDGGRSYPSSASSVILPLSHHDNFQKVEVMICGGAARGAYTAAEERGRYKEALRTCGRMVITGSHHKWKMEEMPTPRLLSDMLILPTSDILIINGAMSGAAGWDNADKPALTPLLYTPTKPLGERFSSLRPTKIPRMYHSSAVLLPDGRVLVSGSNPHQRYRFKNVRYPTELRLQAFVPEYMSKMNNHYRPRNVSISSRIGQGKINGDLVRYGEEFRVRFWLGRKAGKAVEVSAYAPPFTTHSVGMNQRMLRLRCKKLVNGKGGWVTALVEAPPSPNVAPAGYYMLTVVNDGIPSITEWVRFWHHD